MSNKKRKPYGTAPDKIDPKAAKERICFSIRLKEQMEKQQLTYDELSRRTNGNVSASALQSYVARTSEPGKLIILITIAEALGCSVDYLLGRTEKAEDPKAVGIPEYLSLSPKAVQSLHDSTTYLAELGRMRTGNPSVSGITLFSGFLEDHSRELLVAMSCVMDSEEAARDFCKQLADAKVDPKELNLDSSETLLRQLEGLRRDIGFSEDLLTRLIQKSLDEILGIGKLEDDLDALHQQMVQAIYEPDSVAYRQAAFMNEYLKKQMTADEDKPAEATDDTKPV